MYKVVNYLILFLLIFTIQSCKQSGTSTRSTDADKSIKQDENSIQEKKIETIREFYTAYILECDQPLPLHFQKIDSIKGKYFSPKLQEKLSSAELDYDPILNAQDCDKNWIKTLKIVPDTEQENAYKVSYNEDTENQISLSVTEIDGRYMIDDIKIR